MNGWVAGKLNQSINNVQRKHNHATACLPYMLGKMPPVCKSLPSSVLQINSKKVSSVQPSTNCRSGTEIQRKKKEKQRNQLKGVSQNTRNSETKQKTLKMLTTIGRDKSSTWEPFEIRSVFLSQCLEHHSNSRA